MNLSIRTRPHSSSWSPKYYWKVFSIYQEKENKKLLNKTGALSDGLQATKTDIANIFDLNEIYQIWPDFTTFISRVLVDPQDFPEQPPVKIPE